MREAEVVTTPTLEKASKGYVWAGFGNMMMDTLICLSSSHVLGRGALQAYQLKPYPSSFAPSSLCCIRASDSSHKVAVPYVVPLHDSLPSSCITRPLVEILRDLNKRVPHTVLRTNPPHCAPRKYVPWYHANRMLSFYAPGWCGEVRSVAYAGDGKSVTVVYRVTIRGSDGEIYRESSGTVSLDNDVLGDPVQKAEAIAFQTSCARFGLGLYLYHDDDSE